MWARKYDLSWKEIYELDSEFQSLVKIDQENREKDSKQATEGKFESHHSTKKRHLEHSQSKVESSRGGGALIDSEPGFSLKVLKKYSNVFQGKVSEVRNAII